MSEELKPCPFKKHVRSRLKIKHRGCKWYPGGLYAVECEWCGIRGPYRLTEEKAIESWNTRAGKKPTDAVREFAERYEKRIAELEEQITESAGGTLTAEQVREAWCGNLKRDCLYDPPTLDWQAIADELNARAERTCRNEKDKWSGLAKYLFVCSECGWNLADVGNDAIDISAMLMKRCPMCGARLEEVGE